jgi:hypothetical protein
MAMNIGNGARRSRARNNVQGLGAASLLVVLGASCPRTAWAQETSVVTEPRPSKGSVVEAGALRCDFSEHEGLPDADTRTATRLICQELQKAGAAKTTYLVRWERLEKAVIVSVEPEGGTSAVRSVVLQNLSEVMTAAPRLARSVVENRSVAETAEADNLVASETTLNPLRTVRTGFHVGLLGASAVGKDADFSSGLIGGLSSRWKDLSTFVGGRLGGLNAGPHLGIASADVGLKYYFGEGNTAFFAGGGGSLALYTLGRSPNPFRGRGVAAYGEVGVEGLRDRRVGVWASLRCDVPFFRLERTYPENVSSGALSMMATSQVDRANLFPVALNVGVAWH